MIVRCLFEQSGTFKNVFKSLGYRAYDYDILNDFNETDYIIDLFEEIDKACNYDHSIFDTFNKDDLIIAFFPCTRFENQISLSFRGEQYLDRDKSLSFKLLRCISLENERAYLYSLLCKLILICDGRGLKLIIENPYSTQSYIFQYLPLRPAIIINDRSLFGDYYKKPTMFYFINFEPNYNIDCLYDFPLSDRKTICNTYSKVERSLISTDFARYFVKTYIL